MATEQLTRGNDDGTLFGSSSTDKIGFYGLTTPINRPQIAQAAVATTVATSTFGTDTTWGYAGSTQANAIVTLVNELRADLVALGLVGT